MKLGLIGCGKMGGALLAGVIKAKLVKPADISVCDAIAAASAAMKKQHPTLKVCEDAVDVASRSEVVILAVKPKDMKKLLDGIAAGRGPKSKFPSRLFLSIAAGLTISQLEGWLGGKHRVIRSMPNTPALILQGTSAFARGSTATDADAATAQSILGAVGIASEVSETLLDAVTGLSGSGPAYVYSIIEALADGGVLMGLPRVTALQFAAQTVVGAAQMVIHTGEHPAALRDNVASPGGTTIAGLEQLEKHGLRNALLQAVRAATERSKELAKS